MEERGRVRQRLSGAQRRSREREPWRRWGRELELGTCAAQSDGGAWPRARTTLRGDFQKRTL